MSGKGKQRKVTASDLLRYGAGEKVRKTVLSVEIDIFELACRMIEAVIERRRPIGATAMEAVTSDVVVGQTYLRAARAAAEYFTECVNDGKVPS